MPTYDFTCKNGHHIEAHFPLAMYEEVKEGIDCPVEGCEEFAVKDAAGPGFALKGRGWHNTEYHQYGPKRK